MALFLICSGCRFLDWQRCSGNPMVMLRRLSSGQMDSGSGAAKITAWCSGGGASRSAAELGDGVQAAELGGRAQAAELWRWCREELAEKEIKHTHPQLEERGMD
jgi:hypothetical protein